MRAVLSKVNAERNWIRPFILVTAGAALLAILITYLIPPRYTARASILLDAGAGGTNLINLAQITELLPPGAFPSEAKKENGYAYLAIARSRTLLTGILEQPQLGNPTRRYIDAFESRLASPARRTETAVKELRTCMELDFDAKDGVLRIAVTHRDPVVAADVANQMILELKRFNTEVRASRARDAVQFVGARLQESRLSLTDSENRLADFNRANLRIGTAPGLQLQEKRLERNVRLNEEIYALLAKQLELSQIQEKKESAVFTTMDRAIPPTRPNRFSRILTGFLAAFVAGTAFFLFLSWRALTRSHPGQVSEWGDAQGAA